MTRPRDPSELREELREQADETRRLIARYSDRNEAWREKALLACLKNDQAILEALVAVLSGSRDPAPTERGPKDGVRVDGPEDAAPLAVPEFHSVPAPSATPPTTGTVEGLRARAIVEEFDQRDKSLARGIEKLNAWIAGGRGALPFQKREMHAYLNKGANSEAMIARIETELMGREGYSQRLGRLVIEGLEGEVVIYEKRQ